MFHSERVALTYLDVQGCSACYYKWLLAVFRIGAQIWHLKHTEINFTDHLPKKVTTAYILLFPSCICFIRGPTCLNTIHSYYNPSFKKPV